MDTSVYFASRFAASVPVDPIFIDKEDTDFISPLDKDLAALNYVDSNGRLVDVLSQYLHSDSELQRNQLLNLLQDSSTPSGSEFASLDDDTKLRLLKPRSLQSPAELASYTDYVQRFIDSNNSPAAASADNPAADTPAAASADTSVDAS